MLDFERPLNLAERFRRLFCLLALSFLFIGTGTGKAVDFIIPRELTG